MGERASRHLQVLEQIFAVNAVDLRTAFASVADVVAGALGAEKTDVFVHDAASDSLVALGTSATPLGRKQQRLGLDRLPVVAAGRAALVFRGGKPHLTGDASRDPEELPGIVNALGVRSVLIVPFAFGQGGDGERGLLHVSSTQTDAFDPDDLAFAAVLARWIGLAADRARLTERIATESRDDGRRIAAEEIVTVVAHDLRNLLSPALGRVQMIRWKAQRQQGADVLRDVEAAERSLLRAGRALSDLLDVARIDQGLLDLNPGIVDLVALLREAVGALGTPGVAIDLRVPDELVVEGDPARLRQIFENLIGNAVKHAEPGTPVTLEAARIPGARPGEEWAQIEVRNEGAPIPPELAPRIFTRYVRDRGSGGLGLGLYLARELALAHRGDLTLEPSTTGARFRVRIPAAT